MGLMINTTFAIDGSIRTEFLDWLRRSFIPEAMAHGATAVVASRVIGQMIDGPHDDEAEAYACQFKVASREDAAGWTDYMAESLLPQRHAAWGDRFLPFTTFMEIVDTDVR